MLNSRTFIQKAFIAAFCLTSFTLVSCEPAIWQGIAAGMAGFRPAGQYYGASSASYTSTSSYTSSSSMATSKKTCPRCNGTGNCKTCGGSGKVYDYGPASVISKEKYTHNCGVCNGRGKCGVCDGKGHV